MLKLPISESSSSSASEPKTRPSHIQFGRVFRNLPLLAVELRRLAKWFADRGHKFVNLRYCGIYRVGTELASYIDRAKKGGVVEGHCWLLKEELSVSGITNWERRELVCL